VEDDGTKVQMAKLREELSETLEDSFDGVPILQCECFTS
jgi:hypothetical protein